MSNRVLRWMTLSIAGLALAVCFAVSCFDWFADANPAGPTVFVIPAGVVVSNPAAPMDVAALARYQMSVWTQRGSLVIAALSLAVHLVLLNIELSIRAPKGASAPE